MGLRQEILDLPVTELALRPLVTTAGSQTVAQAIADMQESRLGCTVIVDDKGHPVGMFNEKMLIRLLAEEVDFLNDPLEDHMIRILVTIKKTESIAHLINLMQTNTLRWVCVVNSKGKASAITGLRGVVEYITEHNPRSIKVEPIRKNLSMEQREGA